MRKNGRSERPKNGADAQPCLSDVYKDGTRAKRRQADVPLCGRSMVEMLGVLAIIGVLSVGAMNGYSKAMTKYKHNKMLEQFSLFIMNVLNNYSALERGDDDTSNFIAGSAEALNILPDGMRVSYPYIIDTLGNRFRPFIRNGTRRFVIDYYFNDSDYFNGETEFSIDTSICPFLLTQLVQSYSNIIYYVFMYKGGGNPSGASWYGDDLCIGKRKCIKDITQTEAYAMCQECIPGSTCALAIEFNTP